MGLSFIPANFEAWGMIFKESTRQNGPNFFSKELISIGTSRHRREIDQSQNIYGKIQLATCFITNK
jgi:hypothetical protein